MLQRLCSTQELHLETVSTTTR